MCIFFFFFVGGGGVAVVVADVLVVVVVAVVAVVAGTGASQRPCVFHIFCLCHRQTYLSSEVSFDVLLSLCFIFYMCYFRAAFDSIFSHNRYFT